MKYEELKKLDYNILNPKRDVHPHPSFQQNMLFEIIKEEALTYTELADKLYSKGKKTGIYYLVKCLVKRGLVVEIMINGKIRWVDKSKIRDSSAYPVKLPKGFDEK